MRAEERCCATCGSRPCALQAEKAALAEAYEAELGRLRYAPDAVGALEPEVRRPAGRRHAELPRGRPGERAPAGRRPQGRRRRGRRHGRERGGSPAPGAVPAGSRRPRRRAGRVARAQPPGLRRRRCRSRPPSRSRSAASTPPSTRSRSPATTSRTPTPTATPERSEPADAGRRRRGRRRPHARHRSASPTSYLNAELRDSRAQLARSDALVATRTGSRNRCSARPVTPTRASRTTSTGCERAEALANDPRSGALKVGFSRRGAGPRRPRSRMTRRRSRACAPTPTADPADGRLDQRPGPEHLRAQRRGGARPAAPRPRPTCSTAATAARRPRPGAADLRAQQPDGTARRLRAPAASRCSRASPRGSTTRQRPKSAPIPASARSRLFRASEIDPATGAARPGAAGTELVTGGVRGRPDARARGGRHRRRHPAGDLAARRRQAARPARRARPAAARRGRPAGRAREPDSASRSTPRTTTPSPNPPPGTLTGTRTDFSGWDPAANSGTAYLAVLDRSSGATVATVAVDATAATPAGVVDQINAGLGSLGTAEPRRDRCPADHAQRSGPGPSPRRG